MSVYLEFTKKEQTALRWAISQAINTSGTDSNEQRFCSILDKILRRDRWELPSGSRRPDKCQPRTTR